MSYVVIIKDAMGEIITVQGPYDKDMQVDLEAKIATLELSTSGSYYGEVHELEAP